MPRRTPPSNLWNQAIALAIILRPSWGDLLFWMAWAGFLRYAVGYGWGQTFTNVGAAFLLSQVAALVNFYIDARWPDFFGGRAWGVTQRVFWFTVGGAGLLYWLVPARGWEQLLAFRPDWGGALFVLFFGGIIVFALWPIYWLFDTIVKPWAIRTNRHFVGFFAIATIATLYWGGWLAGLVVLFSHI